MARITARIAAAVASGGLAVAVLTGCGAVNAAVDCATVADTMLDVTNKVTGDTETLKASTEKLRKDAETIEDADLKKSALDYADQAEQLNAGLNGDLSAGTEVDPAAMQESLDAFSKKCNALG